MWTPRVYGGGVFPAALPNQLIEPVAKVLHLAGAKDTAHTHQVGLVVTPCPVVGVASPPRPPLRDLHGIVRVRGDVARHGDRAPCLGGGFLDRRLFHHSHLASRAKSEESAELATVPVPKSSPSLSSWSLLWNANLKDTGEAQGERVRQAGSTS
ncbi:hypothetical protein AAFF_G00172120 [Aldrovandia affinis]|uniref:Uncharacterized protein n=1 Tax=Aldrovandia affinis TaxID=143900 RepID=A0AAD7WVK9_9TELE|nr:hypothetical protein AAFF_G00172120 [Aldrovandia affinis]